MARIISRKPAVGIAGSLIFGALGFLLTDMNRLPTATGSAARIMFSILGGFLLFVSVLSLLAALYAIFRTLSARNK